MRGAWNLLVQCSVESCSWVVKKFDNAHFKWEVDTPRNDKHAYRSLTVSVLLLAKGFHDWRIDHTTILNGYFIFGLLAAVFAAGILYGRLIGE